MDHDEGADTMRTKTKLLSAGAAAAMVIGGAGVATATGVAGDDDGTETSITGTDLEKASDAALEHTGEGEVTETEVGDEEGYYEVEVTLDDGSEVDVHLDKNFNVTSSEGDDSIEEEGNSEE